MLYPVLASVLVVVLAVVGSVVFVMATRYPQQGPPEAPQVLTGATVLVGADLEPQEQTTVIIQDGLIQQVGPAGQVAVPADAEVVDLQGATLVPGLIDMHVHLGTPETEGQDDEYGWGILARSIIDGVRHAPDQRRAMLEHGVTSFRSLGDEATWILEVRELVADGTLEGPRVFAAGPLFTSAGGHPVQTLHGGEILEGVVEVPATAGQARQRVRELARDGGVDAIKVVHDRGLEELQRLEPLSVEVLEAIVDQAAAHELAVVGHWGDQSDLEQLLAVGVDGLEHFDLRGPMLTGWPEGQLQSMAEAGLYLGPTLAVIDAAGQGWPAHEWDQLQQRFAELRQAGVPIVAGSDAPLNGLGFGSGLHRELELLVEFGLTPQQALRAATSTAAQALGTEQIGVIEPGRNADLVALGGDPLTEITAVNDVVAVWRQGRPVIDTNP